MRVYLTVEGSECQTGIPEIVLVELQGGIEATGEEFQGLTLGDLQLIGSGQNSNKYSIDIGIHHLEGESKKLDKPLLVTKNNVVNMEEARLDVVGVCKEKIVFNKRPAPILRPEMKKVKLNN